MKLIILLAGLLFCDTLVHGQSRNDIEMEQRITFITLGVIDINTSIDFYENKFGWKRSAQSSDDLIVFELRGLYLALYPKDALARDAGIDAGRQGFSGFTISYNVKSIKEVDDLIAALKSRGVRVVKEPQKVFWGGYSSYIEDPDGNLWEIAYNPYLKQE
ncbi:hypothetical protein SDC9_27641 [bioreactor metagenome]|jgi:catechol 2,3-dioxygenase-like lactoylglutathione lyase family enzyme|uniref:VOC domain-containing protein n=1 Tax=bioreactor metagenome TaxID=1076179 RepID=A0A644USE1_9ZZZZ|nr:VOC family protein [Lentimicrobium sp.]MEA5111844.1 VOC family protein [Lentimicrobium sp.]